MKFFQIFLLLLLITHTTGCQSQKYETYHSIVEIEEVQYEAIFQKVKHNDDKLYVVNFWATWCKPCVEELPEFMNVNEYFSTNPNFKMYLISMDFVKNKETKLIPFLKENEINAEVLLLNDNKRMNTWIPLFDKDWSGAIPATIFFQNNQIVFFKEGTMTEKELKNLITKYIKP